jgi:cyclase
MRDEVVLYAGSRRIELRHPGYSAHTPGDVVAWLPEERVLFAGDLLFHQVTPLVFMGSLAGARRSLEWLDSFGAEVVVPGHGAVIPGADLAGVLSAHDRYYRFVEEVAGSGESPLAVARGVDLGEFAGWPDQERLVLNLHRVYADAAHTEVDLMAAFGDAVTWHGGPLHCTV